MPPQRLKLFLIAGEPSGDRLGAAMLDGFTQEGVQPVVSGVGGPEMAARGLHSLFPYQELALMGLVEILPKYLHLKRRIAETADAIINSDVDALITIDSPDFCHRVAKIVREQRPSLPIIHYVAPSVWAWRAGRAEKMARYVDHVLALLPFEPPFMHAAGMSCDFVGHPAVTERRASVDEMLSFRAKYAIGAEEKLVLVLPGSRRSEVRRLLPVFAEALTGVEARLILPMTGNVAAEVRRHSPRLAQSTILLDPTDAVPAEFSRDKRSAFALASAALAASGTVSLELAANDVPMVIAYDTNLLTRFMLKRLLKIDSVTLVNLVSETREIPEFLGEACRPDPIRAALDSVLRGEVRGQKRAMGSTMERLGRGGEPPGQRAARSVLNYLNT